MTATTSAPRPRITRIGGAAQQALGAGVSGRVIAVFERAFYVETLPGMLACIGPAGMGAGPLNALWAPLPGATRVGAGVRQGAPVRCDGDAVSVDGGMPFDLRGARRWRPRARRRRVGRDPLARGLDCLALALTDYPLREGLAPLLARLCPAPPREGPPPGGAAALPGAAGPALYALRRWLARLLAGATGAPREPPAPAAALIGLGPGLTPSGDDLLAGAMIALRALGRAHAADGLAAWLLPRARRATGLISYAHLACAAQGQGAAPLHELLDALIAGDPGRLRAALRAIDAIGHSSGWDALAGVAFVWEALREGEG